MKYVRTIYKDGHAEQEELSAEKVVELFARVLQYKETGVADRYTFSIVTDEFFSFQYYKLIMRHNDGSEVIHTYLPIE